MHAFARFAMHACMLFERVWSVLHANLCTSGSGGLCTLHAVSCARRVRRPCGIGGVPASCTAHPRILDSRAEMDRGGRASILHCNFPPGLRGDVRASCTEPPGFGNSAGVLAS